MNRFEEGAGIPRFNEDPWNNRANITESRNNHLNSITYKQYFDKDSGQTQHTDQLKYIYKTPSNGM
jgi:hypothetical protein